MSNFTTWRSLVDGEEIFITPDRVTNPPETVEYLIDPWILTDEYSDGDTVSDWTERITETSIPGSGTFRESVVGGTPAVEMNGVDDGFISDITDVSDPHTFFAVVQPFSLQDAQIACAVSGSNQFVLMEKEGNFNFRFNSNSNRTDEDIYSANETLLVSGRCGGSESIGRVNKSQLVTIDQDDLFSSLAFGLKGDSDDYHLEGYYLYQEVHDEALTDSEIEDAEDEIESMFRVSFD